MSKRIMHRIPVAARGRKRHGPPRDPEVVQLEKDFDATIRTFRKEAAKRLGLGKNKPVEQEPVMNAHFQVYTKCKVITGAMCDVDGHQNRAIERLEQAKRWFERGLESILDLGIERRVAEMADPDTILEQNPFYEKFLRVVAALSANKNGIGSTRLGSAVSPDIEEDMREIMDPANKEKMIEVFTFSIIESGRRMEVYCEEWTRRRIVEFMDLLIGVSREFTSQKQWMKAACFKKMCHTHARKNVDAFSEMLEKRYPQFSEDLLAIEALDCPLVLFFELSVLRGAAEVVRGIKTDRTARAIIENPRWVNPATFEELKELAGLLDRFAERREFYPFELVGNLPLRTAIEVARKLEAQPAYLELYRRITDAEARVSSSDFINYMMDVAEEDMGGQNTFRWIVEQIEPYIPIRLLGRVIRASANIYLSERSEDLALLLMEPDKRLAEAALEAIEYGEIEVAVGMIDKRMNAKRMEEELGIEDRVKRAFPNATETQQKLFRDVYTQLGRVAIQPTRFSSLRKHGIEKLENIAKTAIKLKDSAAKIIFASDAARRLFVDFAQLEDENGVLMRINTEAISEKDSDQKEKRIIELMGQHIDENTKLQVKPGRIVVICGEEVERSIQTCLSERTGREVRTMSDSRATYSSMGETIRPGDLVVVVTTHVGHTVSGSAVSLCRSRGNRFVVCGSTNADRIADRINTLAA